MRKNILSIIGIILIGVSIFIAKKLIDNKNQPKPVIPKVVKTVIVDTVQNTTVPIVIPANGNLTAKQRVELYSEVQGIFKTGKKLFKAGTKYNRGETLISIDASEYYASVQSAKSNLYNSIAAIMADLRLDFPEVFQRYRQHRSAQRLNTKGPMKFYLPQISYLPYR